MDDAFSSLTFSSTTSPSTTISQPQSKPNPFATLDQPPNQRSAVASPQVTATAVKGGGFFDPVPTTALKPASTSKPAAKPLQISNNILSLGLGDLNLGASTSSAPQPKPTSTSDLSLFDFAESTPSTAAAQKVISKPSSSTNSAFNLSSPVSTSQGPPKPAASTIAQPNALQSLSSADPWGSNDAWATPEPSTQAPSTTKQAPSIATTKDFSSWAGAPSSLNSAPGHGGASGNGPRAAAKITEDEDFGGWTSAAPISTVPLKPGPAPSSAAKPASGYSASEDLFSNVWE